MSGEVHALFSQYENEYCSKSTELARKTQMIGSLSGGECILFGQQCGKQHLPRQPSKLPTHRPYLQR